MSVPLGRRWSRAWGLVAVGCLLGLAVLAILVALRWHPLTSFDAHSNRSAHRLVLSHHWLEHASRDVTRLGSPITIDVVTAVAVVIAVLRRCWIFAVFIVLVRLLDLGITTLTKDLVERPRPKVSEQITHAAGFSFPSGHAAGSAAVYGALVLLLFMTVRSRVLKGIVIAVVVIGVAAVAASRVLLDVHYPSDVTAGILVGLGALAAVRTVLRAR